MMFETFQYQGLPFVHTKHSDTALKAVASDSMVKKIHGAELSHDRALCYPIHLLC